MSLAQAVHNTQSLPTATDPGAFSAHAYTAVSVAASQFKGDASLKQNHKNSICVTYTPAASIGELCQAAFVANTMGDNDCSYNNSYLISALNSNIPSDGKIKECHLVSDPNEVCVPRGTVALACSPDQLGVGLNVGGGNYQLEPSYIAVPKSEVDLLTEKYMSCYAPHPGDHAQRYAYVKTSSQVGLDEGVRPAYTLNI
jgi:hypothetical protein